MKCRIHRSTNGEYFVRIVSSNGRTLGHSENYQSKSDAATGADIIARGGSVEDMT